MTTANAAPNAPTADLSSLVDMSYGDEIPEQLPEQGGGTFLVVLPQKLTLRMPNNLMQCWDVVPELRWLDPTTKQQPLIDPATQQQAFYQRIEWGFDSDNPLIIVAPDNKELDGQPAPNVRISNIPRMRSKKEGAHAIADATYLLRTSLGLPGSVQLATPKDWVHAMAQFAGKTFRVESGLSAYCNPKKVRYMGVAVIDPVTKQQTGWDSVEDPSGTMGCGKRYYTGDFKYPQIGYTDRVFCQPGKGGPKVARADAPGVSTASGCNAYLRGFFTIDKFLPPQG